MPFRFAWRDENRRVMTYIAEGLWNWRDYHHAARAATFSLSAVDHSVDSLIDLRASARPRLPAGMSAHLRSFNRRSSACLTGRALVIGMPAADLEALNLGSDNILATTDGVIRFAQYEMEMERILAAWEGESESG